MSILQYAINDNNKTNNNKSNKQGNHKQGDHKQSNYENGNSSNGGDGNDGDVNDGDEFFAVRQQRHVKMYAAILKDRYDLSKTKASHLSSSGNDLRTISDIVSSIDQTTTTTNQPNVNQKNGSSGSNSGINSGSNNGSNGGNNGGSSNSGGGGYGFVVKECADLRFARNLMSILKYYFKKLDYKAVGVLLKSNVYDVEKEELVWITEKDYLLLLNEYIPDTTLPQQYQHILPGGKDYAWNTTTTKKTTNEEKKEEEEEEKKKKSTTLLTLT